MRRDIYLPTITWLLATIIVAVPLQATTAPGAAHSKQHLTAIILHDLEFTLLTWKAPTEHAQEMDLWFDTTRNRLNGLRLIAADADLNGNVVNAIDAVDRLLESYDDLQRTLRIADWVDDTVRIEGEATAFTVGSQLIGATLEGASLGWEVGWESSSGNPKAATIGGAVSGLLTMSGQALGQIGRKIELTSKYSRLDAAKASFAQAEIQRTKDRFDRGLDDIREFAKAADGRYSPSFALLEPSDAYSPTFPDSPFPHVLRAIGLVQQDRKRAAAEYARGAEKFPIGHPHYSTYYRGPFLLFAGHLLEVESRLGASQEGRASAARAAVRYYSQAESEISPESVPYSYRISYARALAFTNRVTEASKIAQQLEAELPGSGVYRAARAYDLGCLLALLGRADEALSLLAESYKVFPRRDPSALRDPLLHSLWSSPSRRGRLQRLADHPLVGGSWMSTTDGVSRYYFYPDGSLWQRRTRSETMTGRWSTTDDHTLVLSARTGGVSDARVSYKISGEHLTLLHNGTEYRYLRKDGDLLSGYSNESALGRTLTNDGSWTREVNGREITGRFSTSRTLSRPARIFWYSWEDPIAGPLFEVLQEGKLDQ
jgi:tetratricopeptide (TPR) repeat protein